MNPFQIKAVTNSDNISEALGIDPARQEYLSENIAEALTNLHVLGEGIDVVELFQGLSANTNSANELIYMAHVFYRMFVIAERIEKRLVDACNLMDPNEN